MENFDQAFEDNLEQWMDAHVGKEIFKGGQERFGALIDPYPKMFKERGVKVVIIGGTNGKGETLLALSHLLKSANISHACFISPHVKSIRERMMINGEMISYKQLQTSLEIAYTYSQISGVVISYYELMLLAFSHFVLSQEKTPDICLLEVGIGGRLDGVNFFEPTLTAITSISRDHEDLLGRGYKKILFEKFGITRANTPLLSALELDYLRGWIKRWSKEKGVLCEDLFELGLLSHEDDFHKRNHLLAQALFERVCSQEGREVASLPLFEGRGREFLFGETRVTLVGSHNLDGIRKLVASLKRQGQSFDAILCSLSKRSIPKEPEWMLKSLETLGLPITLVPFDHFKALSAADLKRLATERGHSWRDSLKEWPFPSSVQKVLVTGSYYFVGEALRKLAQ